MSMTIKPGNDPEIIKNFINAVNGKTVECVPTNSFTDIGLTSLDDGLEFVIYTHDPFNQTPSPVLGKRYLAEAKRDNKPVVDAVCLPFSKVISVLKGDRPIWHSR